MRSSCIPVPCDSPAIVMSLLPPLPPPLTVPESLEKVGYAKKMAQGYLRSVGIGQYTPKRSSYIKEEEHGGEHKATHWKKLDQDEFDF